MPWDHAVIDKWTDSVAAVAGDFAEIGVYQGAAFCKLVRQAQKHDRGVHAFDSFHGMGTPTEMDGTRYPRGRFNVGGPAAFRRIMESLGIGIREFWMWPGYIPDCFIGFPKEVKFAFVIIDVDHYEPTAEALRWVHPRLNVGGILALDDYIPHFNKLATAAIKKFWETHKENYERTRIGTQLMLRRMK